MYTLEYSYSLEIYCQKSLILSSFFLIQNLLFNMAEQLNQLLHTEQHCFHCSSSFQPISLQAGKNTGFG